MLIRYEHIRKVPALIINLVSCIENMSITFYHVTSHMNKTASGKPSESWTWTWFENNMIFAVLILWSYEFCLYLFLLIHNMDMHIVVIASFVLCFGVTSSELLRFEPQKTHTNKHILQSVLFHSKVYSHFNYCNN